MTTHHTHTLGGQKLAHDHAGGDVPHGYYQHPEDTGLRAFAAQSRVPDGKYELTSPATETPPKLPSGLPGHVRLFANHDSALGGPNLLTLTGTRQTPRLYADSPDDFSGIALDVNPDDMIRFCREVLASFGRDTGMTLPSWTPANDGSGNRPWFLVRRGVEDDRSVPVRDRFRYSTADVLVRYTSRENAQRAADKLNKQEASS